MDEKILGYLIANNRATDDCLRGVETALDALIKQAKHNKRQKFANVLMGGLILMCMSHIGDLLIKVQKQDNKIAALEAKIYEEGNAKKKGA